MPPRPSELFVAVIEDLRDTFDFGDEPEDARSIGSATPSVDDAMGARRVLGPFFAKPSTTGLNISVRFEFAKRFRKDRTGVVRKIGLFTRLSGEETVAAASAVLRDDTLSALLEGVNLGLSTESEG